MWIKQISLKLGLLLGFVAIIYSLKVPCQSEVLVSDYYGENAQNTKMDRDLSTEIQTFKKTNRFSFSFWMQKDSIFKFQVSTQASSTSPTQILIEIEAYINNLLPTIKVSSQFGNPLFQEYTISNLWTYVFITLDIIDGAKQIYLYTIDSVDINDIVALQKKSIQLVNLNEVTFEYEKILIKRIIPSDDDSPIKTRTIYFHRSYGYYDLKDDDINILKMMLRDNTKLISNFLFNQDILQKYLNEDNEQVQNNINISNQKVTETPILFYRSANFQKRNQIKLNGFRMTQIQREFTVTFSLFTQILDSNPLPYSIMSIQDEQGNSILQIELKRENDFEESIWFRFKNNVQVELKNCRVRRIKFQNYFVINGYTNARFQSDYQAQKYYFDVYLDYTFCDTIQDNHIQQELSSDLYFLVFGSLFSEYSGYFELKALKIYEGAYAPFNSQCNLSCIIQQSRELTSTEKLKLSMQKSGQTTTTIVPNSLYQLANQQVSELSSLSCLRCDESKFMTGEYCATGGASQCTDGMDSSSNQCLPQQLCSDPLHDSSDCIKLCKAGYQIDNSARCAIMCDQTCAKCSRTSPSECQSDDASNPNAACPSSRIFNPTTKKCDCKDSDYYDDGISNECFYIDKNLILKQTPSTSTIKYIYDINYDTSTKPKASMNMDTLINKDSTSPQLIFNTGSTTNTADAHLDYGIQLFSEKYFLIKDFDQFYPMKFWLYTQADLGRFLKVVTFFDSANNAVIRMNLDQINNFEYSITICLLSKCQQISPLLAKIKVSVWTFIGISISDINDYQVTVFINAYQRVIRFEKSQKDPISNSLIKLIKFGDQFNKYSPPTTQFFAVRYITFYTQPFYLMNSVSTDTNCLVYSGKDKCILCKKGYFFANYDSTDCVNTDPKNVDVKKFIFQEIQMIHKCAINQNICSSCQVKPSQCKDCTKDTNRDSLNFCECNPGSYSDLNDICLPCNKKCKTCSSEKTCIQCNDSRINPPDCPCPDQFLEPLNNTEGLCDPCHKTCSSCDYSSNKCICPNLEKTFRIQETRKCPCKPGYYEETESNQVCKRCFQNCKTCLNGDENQCTSCNVDPSQINLILPITVKGECQCKDNTLYLDYKGFCNPYTSVRISLIQFDYFKRPRIKIELTDGQQLEDAKTSKWLSLLDIRIRTNNDKTYKRRNLQEQLSDENNLILTVENSQDQPNVGYINIDINKSCYSRILEVAITSSKAIRTINGVPLKPEFEGVVLQFQVSPFILKFQDDDLIYYENQQKALKELQSNGFVSFLRYISLPLFFMNCLQPIASLLLINTVIPIKSHLIVSQFASFVFPNTPIWNNYELANAQSNNYQTPSYTIFGISVNVEDQIAFQNYQQIGLSANFLVNITETLVFLIINGIVIAALKYLDESQQKFFQGKRYYQYAISFFLNLVEVRLIYILISIFLQFTNMNFSNGLNGVSAIFSCIFLILYLFFMYTVGKVLNSPTEKDDFKFRRMQHLVDFLEFSKHTVTKNYKYIHTIKKILYFLVLVLMYNSPKVSIIILIILSILGFIFDLTRPFRIYWINYLKIISSLAWVSIMISVMVSYNQMQKMISFDFIIDDSTLENYQKSGEAIFYLVWIYFSLNCSMFLLKILDITHQLYTYIKNRGQPEQTCLLIKQYGIERNIAFQTHNTMEDQSNGIAQNIIINAKQKVKDDNFAFNFNKVRQVKQQQVKL